MAESSESTATSGGSEPGPSASSTVAQCSAPSTRDVVAGHDDRIAVQLGHQRQDALVALAIEETTVADLRPGFKANIGDALAERHPKRFPRFRACLVSPAGI